MRSFAVPQFIDIEPRVIGPITVRQFIMLLIAGGIIFIAYKLLVLKLFIVAAIFVGGIAALFAFFKPNGRPFHIFLLNVIKTLTRPAVRTWRPMTSASTEIKLTGEDIPEAVPLTKRISGSKIDELALIVDTGGMYHGEAS